MTKHVISVDFRNTSYSFAKGHNWCMCQNCCQCVSVSTYPHQCPCTTETQPNPPCSRGTAAVVVDGDVFTHVLHHCGRWINIHHHHCLYPPVPICRQESNNIYMWYFMWLHATTMGLGLTSWWILLFTATVIAPCCIFDIDSESLLKAIINSNITEASTSTLLYLKHALSDLWDVNKAQASLSW